MHQAKRIRAELDREIFRAQYFVPQTSRELALSLAKAPMKLDAEEALQHLHEPFEKPGTDVPAANPRS